jgi:hypothetical protein
MNEIVHKTPMPTIVPGKSDIELAAEFKARIVEIYGPVMKLIDETNDAGFQVSITSGKGPLGKQVITNLQVMKVF